MGLLDKIKPHTPPVRPADLSLQEDGSLLVRWDDGKESRFTSHFLRSRCPCAGCVEEWSGHRTVGEAQVAPDVRARGFHPVGRYAVQLDFSDNHQTGIYSWDYLLKLRQEQESA